jgi:hypothetical protein
MKGKNAAKRQIIRHTKYKNPFNWYKNVYGDLFSLKFDILFWLMTNFLFLTYIQDPDLHSFSKLDPDPHKVNADPKHWQWVTSNSPQNRHDNNYAAICHRQYFSKLKGAVSWDFEGLFVIISHSVKVIIIPDQILV